MSPGSRGALNYTDMSIKLANTPHLVGISPRWVSFAVLSKTSNYNRNSSTVALILNSTKEAEIGLGRRWPYESLVGRSCHVTGALLRFLDLKSGDNASLSIDTIELMATAAGYGSNSTAFVVETLRSLVTEDAIDPSFAPYTNLPPSTSTVTESETPQSPLLNLLPTGFSPQVIRTLLILAGVDVDGILSGRAPLDMLSLKRSLTTRQSFIIKSSISDSYGKYPSALGNIVMVEMDTMQEIIREALQELRKGNLNAIFPHLEISPEVQAWIAYFLKTANDPPSAVPSAVVPSVTIPTSLSPTFTTPFNLSNPPPGVLPPAISLPPGTSIPPVSLTPSLIPPSFSVPGFSLPPLPPGTTIPPGTSLPPGMSLPPEISVPGATIPAALPPRFSLPPDVTLPPGVTITPDWTIIPPPEIQLTPDNEIVITPPPIDIPPEFLANYSRLNDTLNNATRDFYLGDYALLVVGMNSQRFHLYSESKTKLDDAFLEWTNQISLTLGLSYGATLTTPLGKMLGVLYYLRLVLDQMLLIIELFLVALGCYLIYSLLLADVESKVYESGMLRALGMQQKTLIVLLSIQSLLFSIPGLSFGLFLAFLAWQPIRSSLIHFMATPTPIMLYDVPVIVGVTVGLLMPLLALIGPIMKSLSKTLRDSLDLYHSNVNDTLVTVTKLENLGLSPGQTWAALLLVVFGFVVYYLAPLSFIFLNLPMFFTIFVFILAGMLIGLSLLAMLLHSSVQQIVMHCIMWFSDARKLKPLVRKNLHGHSSRNRKTAVLFTTCIAFIIFAGSIFQLQTNNITATIEISVGSDLVVATFSSDPNNKIDEIGLSAYLDKMKLEPNSPIVEYGFSTFSINDLPHIGYTRLGNMAEIPTRGTLIYGVTKNFLNSVFDKYFVIYDKESNVPYQNSRTGKSDVIASLYTTPQVVNPYGGPNATQHIPETLGTKLSYVKTMKLDDEYIYTHTFPVIISTALLQPLSVDIHSPIATMVYPISEKVGRHLAFNQLYGIVQPRAIISKLPGFFISSYKQTASFSPMIVSMDAYDHLRHLSFEHSYLKNDTISADVPKRALFVRLRDSTDTTTREMIANGLRNYVTNDLVQVLDSKALVTAISSAVWVLYIFSNIVAFLVQLLCFFTLLVSFTSNINENSWEFGVLRSMGLTSLQVIRLYIYEASCIIVASLILGSFVGLAVAVTLTLQANLFSELPFRMEFPTFLFCSIVIMSVVTAFLSSYLPAKALGAKRIAGVLKGK